MHGIAADLGYDVWEPEPAVPDRIGRKPGINAGRSRGSQPPPDGSRFPKQTAMFVNLSEDEALDRLAGAAGTTLPSAQTLTAYRDAYYQSKQAETQDALQEAARMNFENRDAAGRAKRMEMPSSQQQKFAWGAERVADALLSKLDTYASRHEDRVRKLLWTFGTDPHMLGQTAETHNQIRLTPANLPRLCDRFGIPCTKEQAGQLFATYGMPADGTALHQLGSKFIESNVDASGVVREQTRRLHGNAARPVHLQRPRTPKQEYVPHRLACLQGDAWAHRKQQQQQQPPPQQQVQPQPQTWEQGLMNSVAASALGGTQTSSLKPSASHEAYAGVAGGTRAAAIAATNQR